MAPTTQSSKNKGLRIGKALRSAAKLPGRVSRVAGRSSQGPKAGEEPVVILRVQILGCNDLLAKDRNGTSDPFVVATLSRQRHATPVCKKNLNPTYTANEATFDFPIFLSLADKLGVLELIVWDKDMLRKEYLGEASLTIEDWFKNGEGLAFVSEKNFSFEVPLLSTRTSTSASGTVNIKLGFVPQSELHESPDYSEIFQEILKRSRGAQPSLMSAPPHEGIGTIRSHLEGPAFEDDGLTSDEDDDDDDESPELTASPKMVPSELELEKSHLAPPSSDVTPIAPVSVAPTKTSSFPFKKALKRPPLLGRSSTASTNLTVTDPEMPRSGTTTPTGEKKRPKFRRAWGTKASEYNLSTSNDMLGIVMLEIIGAENLPKVKNMTRTGWDMDPFVVVSFGKKVFRTRVIRHSLNPKWDEKLLFHVRRYESQFNVQFSVLDWDKLTSNDHVGDATINLTEFLSNAPECDEKTGLYPSDADGTHDMQEFKLSLKSNSETLLDALTATPQLIVRAKYQPYGALRQKFWRQYLKQYDADDTQTISMVEISSMLDSLGSTLSQGTIKTFFHRYGKNDSDELTIEEAIQCLEAEVSRPRSERKVIHNDEPSGFDSGVATPNTMAEIKSGLKLESLDFSGPPRPPQPFDSDADSGIARKPTLPPSYTTEASQTIVASEEVADTSPRVVPNNLPHPYRQSSASSSEADDSSGNSSEESVERVINVKTCPLCHRPRLNAKAEMDIVTHIALCASQDWNSVDRIVVGNFVTPSQAHRKWFMKVISKVSSGSYQLGANSANIIVQNRLTGQLEEEKMQVYVRLGIRLLYKGATGRMEGARARRLLKSLSIKQGKKYDSPASAAEIPTFIEFHKLNTEEIRDPIPSFKTFNEFFYRKLKEDARPVTNPDDPMTLVSGADCRMMAFESVSEATKLWIKGREFSIARLLGDAYKEQVPKYTSGALAIFRLAPQDYHRFHSPVDGVIGPMTYIAGEYYTVNPQAIRTGLDVYGENARKIVPIDSPVFGRVIAVCVGAMMVGSIITTVNEGDHVARGQEFGYFAFGGSTIVLLFEKDAVEWDEDLLINGRACLETLVRVGMGVGRSVRTAK